MDKTQLHVGQELRINGKVPNYAWQDVRVRVVAINDKEFDIVYTFLPETFRVVHDPRARVGNGDTFAMAELRYCDPFEIVIQEIPI